MQQVRTRCAEVVAKAKELYGIDMSGVPISFNLRGLCAGRTSAKRIGSPVMSSYLVKFNADMLMREASEHVINDTVPHEYAHILSFIDPIRFGRGHDYVWSKTCQALGGGGATRHQEEVVYGTGTTYEYTTSHGNKVRLSDKKHAQVQRGAVLRYRKGLGEVSITCAYSIVGHQGRTFAAPIPKTPPVSVAPVVTPKLTTYKVVGTKEVLLNAFFPEMKPMIGPNPIAPVFNRGESKASIARAVMLAGHNRGLSGEAILQAIMQATGHDRGLSKSYYKNNAGRVGIPYNL